MIKARHILLLFFTHVLLVNCSVAQKDTELSKEALVRRVDSLEEIVQPDHKAILTATENLLKTAKELKDTSSLQSLLSLQGKSCYYSGKTDSAIRIFKKIAFIDSVRNNEKKLATDHNNLAVFYKKMGNLDKAENFYRKNLKIFSRLTDTARLASTYLNLGNLNFNKGYLNTALENMMTAHDYSKQIGDSSRLVTVNVKLGNFYTKTKDYKQAKAHFHKALQYYNPDKDELILKISCFLNFGKAYIESGQADTASQYLNQALRMAKGNHAVTQKAYIFLELSKVKMHNSLFRAAQEYVDSALFIARDIQQPKLEIRARK